MAHGQIEELGFWNSSAFEIFTDSFDTLLKLLLYSKPLRTYTRIWLPGPDIMDGQTYLRKFRTNLLET